jgi:hypothetical protein
MLKKALGFALASALVLTLSASANEVKGTVTSIDRTDKSVVLDDGTKLWVSDSQISNLTPGDQVRAMYEVEGGKRMVTGIDHRSVGSDDRATTNFGPNFGTEIDSIQSAD